LQTDKFQEMLKEQKVSDIIDESSIQESYTKWNKEVLKIRDMCQKKVKLNKNGKSVEN